MKNSASGPSSSTSLRIGLMVLRFSVAALWPSVIQNYSWRRNAIALSADLLLAVSWVTLIWRSTPASQVGCRAFTAFGGEGRKPTRATDKFARGWYREVWLRKNWKT